MKPGLYNFEVFARQTFNRKFTVSDTDIDLTEYDNVRMIIRKNPGGAVFWDSDIDVGGSIEIISATEIELLLESPTTEGFRFDEAQYTIELVKDGTPDTIDIFLYGKVVLNKGTPS